MATYLTMPALKAIYAKKSKEKPRLSDLERLDDDLKELYENDLDDRTKAERSLIVLYGELSGYTQYWRKLRFGKNYHRNTKDL